MPIYEYRCEKCGTVFSELWRMSEREDPIDCPRCKAQAKVVPSCFAQTKGESSSSSPTPPCGSGFS